MYKTKIKGAFRAFLASISSKTVNILNAMLLPLTVAFIYIGIDFCVAACNDIVRAKSDYYPIFEHLMLSFVIVICASALLDLSLRQIGDDK